MNATLTDMEFRLFSMYIKEKCGIDIPEEKAYLIETRLSNFLAESGQTSFEGLYNIIRHNNDVKMAEKVIDAITTNETLWFRDKTPWAILENICLPRFVQAIRSGQKQKIRIWSAAASTGQEAYSTAMCIDSWLNRNGIRDISLQNFEITATDISQTVLEIARNGRYDAITIMRGLEPHYKEAYFVNNGMVWEIDQRIKAAVRFQQFNLQNSFTLLGKFDVIFCRYVLIYFSDSLKLDIAGKLSNLVEDDSVLFIGASELYESLGKYFELLHFENGTYYIRRR